MNSRRVWGLDYPGPIRSSRYRACHVAFRTLKGVGVRCQFTELNTHPAYPLSTCRCVPRDTSARLEPSRSILLSRKELSSLLHAG